MSSMNQFRTEATQAGEIYRCQRCTFATLSPEEFAAHWSNQHGPEFAEPAQPSVSPESGTPEAELVRPWKYGSHHPDNELRTLWRNSKAVDDERERAADTIHQIIEMIRANPEGPRVLALTPSIFDRVCDAVAESAVRGYEDRMNFGAVVDRRAPSVAPETPRAPRCVGCGHPESDHVDGHGCTARVPTNATDVGEECDCGLFRSDRVYAVPSGAPRSEPATKPKAECRVYVMDSAAHCFAHRSTWSSGNPRPDGPCFEGYEWNGDGTQLVKVPSPVALAETYQPQLAAALSPPPTAPEGEPDLVAEALAFVDGFGDGSRALLSGRHAVALAAALRSAREELRGSDAALRIMTDSRSRFMERLREVEAQIATLEQENKRQKDAMTKLSDDAVRSVNAAFGLRDAALSELATLKAGPHSIRKCRGSHWHVVVGGNDPYSGCASDAIYDEAAATVEAERLNAEWNLSKEKVEAELAAALSQIEGLLAAVQKLPNSRFHGDDGVLRGDVLALLNGDANG